MTLPRLHLAVCLFALAIGTTAQDKQPLLLQTVLERGPALTPALPRVVWQPGDAATVVLRREDGSETLHRWLDGNVAAEVLVDAKNVLAALGDDHPAPYRFPELGWADDHTLRLVTSTALWRLPLGEAKATALLTWPQPEGDEPIAPAIAPGDRAVAYVHMHDLWLATTDGRVRRVTFDGSADVVYGGAAHRAEFGIDHGLFWSPDGRFLAFYREDQRPIAPYPYQDLDAMPPTPREGRYPMAGRAQSRVRVGVLDTTTAGIAWLAADPDEDVFWTNVTPAADGTLVTARVARSQDRLELVRYDMATGKRLAVLLQDQNPNWLEPEHGPTFLADGRFLWWSLHEGHRHLALHDAAGALVAQVTKGAFDVQQLLGLAADGQTVWFAASGEDPRQLHLFAAPLAGGDVRQVTRERGVHTVALSPGGKFAYAVWSNLETPPAARIVDLASGTAHPLPQLPDPLAGFALPTQRMFQVKADDESVLYGHLALPPGMVENQRYPVLIYVYGGPHVQLVTDQWLGGAPLWLQAFAAEGYVVCRLDNRGTPNRGVAFEQAVFRHLGTAEVQDQLKAVEWLAKQPFVDPQRIGVHGWSFGGYLTLRLLLLAPTTFACGVSGAPVTDWTMYETGYTERYMDTPAENPDGYAASSCLPLVDKLERPLLLVHGTDDRTVMWSHTLDFVDRCIDAGKQLDYFVYPMQTHRLAGRDRVHFLKLLHDWLGRHLQPEK